MAELVKAHVTCKNCLSDEYGIAGSILVRGTTIFLLVGPLNLSQLLLISLFIKIIKTGIPTQIYMYQLKMFTVIRNI